MPGGARPGIADRAIDAIIATASDHTPGTRPIHAPGIGATGRFHPSDVASTFTDAPHLSGPSVPVTVRFSNGTGSSTSPDSEPVVRGMAVRFHLGEVSRDDHGVVRGTDEADMICMTLPVFFTRTVERFMEFLDAVRPVPVAPTPRWRKVVDALRLLPAPSRPFSPQELGAVRFAMEHPEVRRSVVALTALSVPQSYVTCTYHAVHAFVLRAGHTRTPVRFRWEPVAGVRSAVEPEGDFLKRELGERLARGAADFVLRMQVGEQGDDTSDPTRAWPETRRRVVMGHLRVDALVPDQLRANERLAFDPTRLVPGIELSDDPILLARGDVYPRSAERRLQLAPSAGPVSLQTQR